MKHSVRTSRMGNMQFDALVSNHHVILDAASEVGGQDAFRLPTEKQWSLLTKLK